MGSFDTKMLGNFDHKIKIELNNILDEWSTFLLSKLGVI